MSDIYANTPLPRRLLQVWPRRRHGGIRGIPVYWAIPGLAIAVAVHYVAVAANG